MRQRKAVTTGLVALMIAIGSSTFVRATAPPVLERNDHGLERKIQQTYAEQTAQAGGEWYSYVTVTNSAGSRKPVVEDQVDTLVYAYSVNKLAVALAVMDKVDRGELRLAQKIELTPDLILAGSGIDHLQPVYGDHLTIANIITALLLVSDNTAVRLLGGLVPGPEINQILERKGFQYTRVDPFPDNPHRFFLHQTTPREMHRLLEGLANKTLLSEQSSDFLLTIMRWSSVGYNDGIRRNMSSEERARCATKYGAFEDSRNEIGIMFDPSGAPALIYTFFTTGVGDINNYGATNPAVEAHAALGRTMLDAIKDMFDTQPKARHQAKEFDAAAER